MSRSDAQAALGLAGQANFRDRYLEPALKAGAIEMTRPEFPRSSKQRYRITKLGAEILEKSRKKTK